MLELFSLKGKVAIVTRGLTGSGKTRCARMAAAGAHCGSGSPAMPTGSKLYATRSYRPAARRPYLRSTLRMKTRSVPACNASPSNVAESTSAQTLPASSTGSRFSTAISRTSTHPRDQPARNISSCRRNARLPCAPADGGGASLRRHPAGTARSCQASCLLRVEVGYHWADALA